MDDGKLNLQYSWKEKFDLSVHRQQLFGFHLWKKKNKPRIWANCDAFALEGQQIYLSITSLTNTITVLSQMVTNWYSVMWPCVLFLKKALRWWKGYLEAAGGYIKVSSALGKFNTKSGKVHGMHGDALYQTGKDQGFFRELVSWFST